MKHKYTKPACQLVNIQMNDLCVGSKNATIPIHIQAIQEKKRFQRTFKERETSNFWDDGNF